MSFPPGTKIVCIDATPIPILAREQITVLDFTFPNGFLQEGRIYCVEVAIPLADGSHGLHLLGLPIFARGTLCNWHSSRFRMVEPRTKRSETANEQKQILTPSTRAHLTQFPGT